MPVKVKLPGAPSGLVCFSTMIVPQRMSVLAWAELFPVLDSSVVVETTTLFVKIVAQRDGSLLTVTLIVMDAVAPPARSPRLQVTVCPEAEHVPLPTGLVFVHEPDTKVTPAGSVSVTMTLAAVVLGSRLVTVRL